MGERTAKDARGRKGAGPARIADLESAFELVVRAFEAECVIEPGNPPTLRARTGAPPARLRDELGRRAEAVREILTGSRKSWADDLLEAAISPEMNGHQVVRVHGVLLEARRTVRAGFAFDLTAAGGIDRLSERLAGINGVILRKPDFAARAGVGLMLGAAGLDFLRMTEVDVVAGADYRDYLAGSAWLDMPRARDNPAPFADALMLAMQARSLRRQAMTERKQSYYAACAVKALGKETADVEEIARRANVPVGVAERWLGASPGKREDAPLRAEPASARRPATDRQKTKIRRQIDELPALRRILPDDWERDLKAASSFIGRGEELLAAYRDRAKALAQERASRRAIAGGRCLDAAAAESGLCAADLRARLERDFDAAAQALAQELSSDLGTKIRPEDLFPAEG